MITDKDLAKLKQVFTTKDDLISMEKRLNDRFATKDDLISMEKRLNDRFATKDDLSEFRKAVVKDITDYLQKHIILLLNEHEARLDRLEKSVGGFPPIAS